MPQKRHEDFSVCPLFLKLPGQLAKGNGDNLILYDDTIGNLQVDGGEVPDGFDAAFHQLVANLLCMEGRDGDDADMYLHAAAETGHSLDGENGTATDLPAYQGFIRVKGSDYIHTVRDFTFSK